MHLPTIASELLASEQDFGNTLFNRLGNMVRMLSEALRSEIEFIEREYDEKVCKLKTHIPSYAHTHTHTKDMHKGDPSAHVGDPPRHQLHADPGRRQTDRGAMEGCALATLIV